MLELDSSYSIKDDIYRKFIPTHIKNHYNINDSVLNDSVIITISIVSELLTIDSEDAWFSFCYSIEYNFSMK